MNQQIILVAEDRDIMLEARVRLARVGIENVTGFLDGGIRAWQDAGLPLASTEQITVDELNRRLSERENEQLIDVRRSGEWLGAHIAKARHVPLHQLPGRTDDGARQPAVRLRRIPHG